MLILKDIVKDYVAGDTTVRAMRGISVSFRENEFVAILGPSGCGKTTMLNVIGGLDRYTSGDLIINGKSTKTFTDEDWDTYRNHSVGFVFQNYNLIPHQTVLSNVELALTLSGVSKKERRDRALEALRRVGLEAQANKRPTQMSGGQMQRVAIARALINNPDIILADEPTGALDSETSVQIMELLKEISSDKLIIMVTHNPELAYQYANRIVGMLDGEIVNDSNAFEPQDADFAAEEKRAAEEKAKGKKPSMSMRTAFSLSLRNLTTKKGRTFLTAFAGSIGIIGIALVLALSNGIQVYIDKVQNDTLLAFPMTVDKQTMDFSSLMSDMTGIGAPGKADHDLDKIYVNKMFETMVNTFVTQTSSNNLGAFRTYVEDNKARFRELCNDVQYKYSTPLNIYKADTSDGLVQVNPNTLMDQFDMGSFGLTSSMTSSITDMTSAGLTSIWTELIGDNDVISGQYDVLYGKLPQNYNEVVLIVDSLNEINEMVVYGLGLKDQNEFMTNIMQSFETGEEIESASDLSFTYDDILNMKFKLVLNCDYMRKDEKTGLWTDMRDNSLYVKDLVDNGVGINIVGILRPRKDNVISIGTGSIGYSRALMDFALEKTAESKVVREQLADTTKDVLTGETFVNMTVNDFDLADIDLTKIDYTLLNLQPFLSMASEMDLSQIDIMDLSSLFDFSNVTDFQKKLMEGFLNDEQVLALKQAYLDTINKTASLSNTYATLGYSTADTPTSIFIYPKSFEAKAKVNDMIDYYNKQVTEDGHPEYAITCTDYIGLVMDSVTKILNIVTYVLVAFVGISLVVSSIMIGIITYISVLERTKEIGVLRAIGASKRDVANVFNAETVAIGLGAGVIGILATLLLEIPINLALHFLTNTGAAASLPFLGGVILVVISVFLTFISGLIPSSMAAKKDPVEALRTE
ncbi:MAG: ABC transporter ATP-binding protein/permease [Clostridia bacterium]|nr:ABC transporter ATP-binding protein/permease [Clostridia bacterium]